MNRLDQHVDAVRTRFLIQKMVNYAAWTVLCAGAALIIVTMFSRLFAVGIPPRVLLIGGAAVLAAFIAAVLAIAYSPSREATAVQIDQTLGLKERFSTALEARSSNDPFAQAAVRDAEEVAASVSIRKRFPLRMPGLGYYAIGAVIVFAGVDRLMPQWDLLGRKESQRQSQVVERKRQAAEKALREALAEVMSIPKVGAQEKNLQAARKDIEALLNQDIKDPIEATKTAQNALREAENARQKIQDNQRYADAQTQKEAFKSLASQQGAGVLADAKKSLGEGKFDETAAKLKEAMEKFNSADAPTQEKMAAEMKTMADQLAKMAQEPATQERIKKELQKQGATPEQARQMAEEMSKAAAGDKGAQERVKNMAENLARRANGGILPAPEQLAPLMQKLQQMQGQMNSQARAGDMAQAVSQLASAMQNQAAQNKAGQQQQGQQPGQKKSGQQQANQKQPGQQAGQGQSGQQSAANQQSQQGQDGQQSGQQQSAGQQNADAQQAMDAAMSQLEAMQQAADASEASRGGGQQGEGDGQGDGQGWGEGQNGGQQAQGGQGHGQGPSGPNSGGIGEGPRPRGVPAPFTVKKEVSPGETDQKGKLIATWLVKADSVKGESKEQFKQIVVSQQRDQADDVEQNRVPMRAQKAVRDYFQALQDEAK